MKITIEGVQGTKKALLAEVLRAVIVFADPKARVIVRAEDGWVEGAMPNEPTHTIQLKDLPEEEF